MGLSLLTQYGINSSSGALFLAPPGQIEFTTPGTYTWTAPDGVLEVSAVAVGGGANGLVSGNNAIAGSGGGLGWKNNIPVTPGQSYTVVVGGAGQDSFFVNSSVVRGGGGKVNTSNNVYDGGGTFTGDGGGNGGNHTNFGAFVANGAGGAGGYTGKGGNGAGGFSNSAGQAGAGGGGGGGGAKYSSFFTTSCGGAGGGVGIYGQGANGPGGRGGEAGTSGCDAGPGGAGSNGSGQLYGGGGSAFARSNLNQLSVGPGGTGAVRIIWAGDGSSGPRAFPSTNTQNVFPPGAYVTDGLLVYLDAANTTSYPGTGNTWFDLSGNNYHATRVNNVPYVATSPSYFDFAGTGTRYFTLNNATVPAGTTVTLEFWNQSYNAKQSSIIYGNDGSAQDLNIHLTWSDSTIYWDHGNSPNGNRINKNASGQFTGWHHWVFTKGGGTMEIFRDGVLWHSGTGMNAAVNAFTSIVLGSNLNGLSTYVHPGAVSLFRSYNKRLTSAEVLQNFNVDKARFGL